MKSLTIIDLEGSAIRFISGWRPRHGLHHVLLDLKVSPIEDLGKLIAKPLVHLIVKNASNHFIPVREKNTPHYRAADPHDDKDIDYHSKKSKKGVV